MLNGSVIAPLATCSNAIMSFTLAHTLAPGFQGSPSARRLPCSRATEIWLGLGAWLFRKNVRPMKSPRQFTSSLISWSLYLVRPNAATASWSDLPETSFVCVRAPSRTRRRRLMARASSGFKPCSRDLKYGAPDPATGIAGIMSLLALCPDFPESADCADVRDSVPKS